MNKRALIRSARLFGAMAHPVRLQILEMLAQGEACVCHLSSALHQRQAYVSQQLAKLREEGLIADRKEGLFVYYRLADPSVAQLADQAREVLACISDDPSFLQREPIGFANDHCPCPRCQIATRSAQASQTLVAGMTA